MKIFYFLLPSPTLNYCIFKIKKIVYVSEWIITELYGPIKNFNLSNLILSIKIKQHPRFEISIFCVF